VRAGAQPAVSRVTLRALAPSALPVMEQVLRKEQPARNEVLTPEQARRRYGRLLLQAAAA
jgi:hypothetical protein